MGRPRPARQQRRGRDRWPHRRRVDGGLGTRGRHQPPRRRPWLPHDDAAVQGAAQRPHRQRRLARRSRPRTGDVVLQRHQGRCCRPQRDALVRARAVGDRRVRRVPRLLPHEPPRVVRRQGHRHAGGRHPPHHGGEGRRPRHGGDRPQGNRRPEEDHPHRPSGEARLPHEALRTATLRPGPGRPGEAAGPARRHERGGVRAVTEVAGAEGVRAEDAFDVERVASWLRGHGAPDAHLVGIPEVLQFVGGASNLTYLLRYAGRDLVLRRPPPGTKAMGAHDMRREHDIQAALAPLVTVVPRMVAYCDDESVIGSEFYVMERVDGTILRRDLPSGLAGDRERVEQLCCNAVDVLVALHEVDVKASGLAPLDRGEGYVRRQVEGWSDRYRRAGTEDVPDFEASIAWLETHQPADRPHVLIHNDFRFDNLVLATNDLTRVVGVLDWEMATVGDPLMDLASALAYWVQADDPPAFLAMRRQPTHAPGMLTRSQVVERYASARRLEVTPGQWRFYDVFGAFRLAAIAQQIYYRFHRGETSNPAYGEFREVVRFLDHRCAALLGATS